MLVNLWVPSEPRSYASHICRTCFAGSHKLYYANAYLFNAHAYLDGLLTERNEELAKEYLGFLVKKASGDKNREAAALLRSLIPPIDTTLSPEEMLERGKAALENKKGEKQLEAFDYLDAAANRGNPEAAEIIGDYYSHNDCKIDLDRDKDDEKAFDYYQIASDSGNASATLKLAELHKLYNSLDYSATHGQKALECYEKLGGRPKYEKEMTRVEAILTLCSFADQGYSLKDGTTFIMAGKKSSNIDGRLFLFKCGADRGEPRAMLEAGRILLEKKRYEDAFSYFEKAVNSGDNECRPLALDDLIKLGRRCGEARDPDQQFILDYAVEALTFVGETGDEENRKRAAHELLEIAGRFFNPHEDNLIAEKFLQASAKLGNKAAAKNLEVVWENREINEYNTRLLQHFMEAREQEREARERERKNR